VTGASKVDPRHNLSNLSRILHPWRLSDSRRQTSKEVKAQLRAELQAIETLLETNGLPLKKDTLDKVQKQLAGISALILRSDGWLVDTCEVGTQQPLEK